MNNSALGHRKAIKRIQILGADGAPLRDHPVQCNQARHAFLFGCGAFDALELTHPDTPEERRAFLQDRMEKWLQIFNFGTLPFYWGRFEPRQGEPKTVETRRAAEFLRGHGVAVKGHPLCWHTVCADWLLPMDNETILRMQLERIARDVGGFEGLIDMWDVINEVVIMPVFDKYDNAITRICKELGRTGMVREVFAAARAANPGGTLLLNDFNTSAHYERLIEDCLEVGIPIDAIGIQSHQHQGYWGLEKLQEVLSRFSRFGLPIHFTENTLISGEIMPAYIEDLNDWQVEAWPSTPEGETRQASEMAEMYTVLFEHPSVEAITTWDHVDGKWLHAPSGVLRTDNSIKPSHQALHTLIKGEWWTTLQTRTNEDGFVELEGFKGEYEIVSGRQKATLALLDGEPAVVTLG